MLAILGTLLSGIFGGGATGLLGVLIQRFFDAKAKGQELEVIREQGAQAQALRKIELEAQERMAAQTAEVQRATAQLDAQAKESELSARSFEAVVAADKATYSDPEARKGWVGALLVLVDVVRGLVRPGITLYSMILLTLLMLWVQDLYRRTGVVISATEVKELTMQVVGTITYLVTSVTIFWFGTRPSQQAK